MTIEKDDMVGILLFVMITFAITAALLFVPIGDASWGIDLWHKVTDPWGSAADDQVDQAQKRWEYLISRPVDTPGEFGKIEEVQGRSPQILIIPADQVVSWVLPGGNSGTIVSGGTVMDAIVSPPPTFVITPLHESLHTYQDVLPRSYDEVKPWDTNQVRNEPDLVW